MSSPHPQRRINWVRGLFRLWLVLALVWIGWWAILFRPDQALPGYYAASEKLKAAEEASSDGELPDTEEPRERQSRIIITPPAYKIPDGFVPMADPKLTARLDAAVEADRFRALVAQHQRQIEEFAVIGVTPPMILLVLGTALIWALRGFQSGQKGP